MYRILFELNLLRKLLCLRKLKIFEYLNYHILRIYMDAWLVDLIIKVIQGLNLKKRWNLKKSPFLFGLIIILTSFFPITLNAISSQNERSKTQGRGSYSLELAERTNRDPWDRDLNTYQNNFISYYGQYGPYYGNYGYPTNNTTPFDPYDGTYSYTYPSYFYPIYPTNSYIYPSYGVYYYNPGMYNPNTTFVNPPSSLNYPMRYPSYSETYIYR